MNFRVIAGAVLALLAATATSVPAQTGRGPGGPGGFGGPSGAAEVGVITLATRDVPYSVTLPGRAVAWQTADIRPRVSGVIAEILYDPGRPITAGDAMFRIEDDTYRAALASAEAGMRQAEAAVATAESTLKRARSLLGTGSTQASVEAAELALAQAEASLSAAQAQTQVAQLDVDRTLVRSPIDGMAEIPEVSIGAIVTANQSDPLTVVRRIDPIYVDVAESSAAMLRTRDRFRARELQPDSGLGVRLTLEDGRIHESEGRMVSRGTAVSASTGTATFRFAFDNPHHLILPGQFLRVQVTLGTTRAVLVPQRATSRSADGRLTAFTIRDGRAVQVVLTEAGVAENAWVVTAGVEAGDPIIVDGLQNLRDGAEVQPVPVEISADGVVTDLPRGSPSGSSGSAGVTRPAGGSAAPASGNPASGPAPQPGPTPAAESGSHPGNDAAPEAGSGDTPGATQPPADAAADAAPPLTASPATPPAASAAPVPQPATGG